MASNEQEICAGPFCDLDHTHWVAYSTDSGAIDDLDDWEGPMQPEFSEWDAEAFDEMVRDDMGGRF